MTKAREPKSKCIFRKSCSHYVYEQALKGGFLKGLKAFCFRFANCRSGFELFRNPMSNEIQMLLPSQIIINSEEIAERLLVGLK